MKHRRWSPVTLVMLLAPFAGALACEGDTCGASSCGAGSVCRSDGACAPLRALREACESDTDCEPGLFCLTGPTSTLQCSRSTGAPGEPCGTASENAVLACAPGSACVYRRPVQLSSVAADESPGVVAYWGDTHEGFVAFQGPGEDICVAQGSLTQGEECDDDANCAPGLICHGGYAPKSCQPQSGLGQPCSFSADCASDYCEIPSLRDDYDPDGASCALADPSCDIRVDASCGHWLSCQVCARLSDLIGPEPLTDAGAPDAAP
jgi:hypothetical protein